MRVLVTGGAGFIGSHLCEELCNRGHDVVCVDNLSTGKQENISNFNLKFINANVNNLEQLKPVFQENSFDWVLHHAAVVGVKRTIEHPVDVLNDAIGIRNVLNLSRKYNTGKVVFASSSEVYGEPVQIPEAEDGHINAQMPYAVTKLYGENLLKAYHDEFGLKTASLRFFNVYGPRQDSSPYGFVTGIFIKQALNNQSPQIYGDGTQTRDFVYIKDNINATIEALKSQRTDGEILNIGTGRPITILDLAETIIELCGKPLKPQHIPHPGQDIKHRFPDVKKMRTLLDYKPQYNLIKGLKETIEWYKQIH